ncbi:hypothetical protein FHS21_006335 [Phyllobacterium trifolii]|uniref:Immunity MXAN-0049 protein domain-containing protein n=1 Tax=Phyllobacterium trifolii TaxID=300193 RepID=A0A839UFD8_9HYPH|nr:DUF1629 domain-containing protein [Phyllobacterium trifolii]MBB3149878.1 hypothetical protein [Phyllobacterium trifolii]
MQKHKKLGKFFQFGPTFRGGNHGLELQNPEQILLPGRLLLGPPIGKRGFLPYPEVPQFRPAKKEYDRPPRDLEQYDHYWLVSQRLKDVLTTVDPDGVAFADCLVTYISGKPIEPRHYLCDVIRVIDALDEPASTVRFDYEQGIKLYDLSRTHSLIFDETVVGNAHIFRQAGMGGVIGDAFLRTACINAGIKDPHLFWDLS